MKNGLKIGIAFLLLIGLAGCDEQQDLYNTSTSWLNFNRKDGADTLVYYSFRNAGDIEWDTVWLNVKTTGNVVDYDREVAFQQVNIGEADAAVAGVHYVAFDDVDLKRFCVVPRNRATAKIPVVLLRDSSLKVSEKVLKIKIVANELFLPGFADDNRMQLNITDRLSKPENWNAKTEQYFGIYGPVLHEFLREASGEAWDYDYLYSLGFIIPVVEIRDLGWIQIPVTTYTDASFETVYCDYLTGVLKKKLEEKNADLLKRGKEPLKEADGTPVKIGK